MERIGPRYQYKDLGDPGDRPGILKLNGFRGGKGSGVGLNREFYRD